MHKAIPKASLNEFERQFKQPLDNMVVEVIHQLNTPFFTMRRFAKLDGEWYLIYYMAPNALKMSPIN